MTNLTVLIKHIELIIQQFNNMNKTLGIFFIFISVVIVGVVLYLFGGFGNKTRPFSSHSVLSSSWEKYKVQFINQDGRVIDYSQGDITTSEGQSYAMLRAVWIDDKPAFDQIWKWTQENLKRPNDNLFGWRWGLRTDNTYGFLENGGENSASDADSDIALALILARYRWNQASYEQEAKDILTDMWKIETFEIGGRRYLAAGNWSDQPEGIVINPSYFAPYAWRVFAKIDPKHDWALLIDPAYELLAASGETNLDKTSAVGLPPDWVTIDKHNGSLKPVNIEGLSTNYSYDATRIPWRVALDYIWYKDSKASEYLIKYFGYLSEYYAKEGKIVNTYAHDGTPLTDIENPVTYSTTLGYLLIADSQLAEKIYQEKVVRLYSNDDSSFRNDLPYYEQNWLWFGVAMMNNQLINYAK